MKRRLPHKETNEESTQNFILKKPKKVHSAFSQRIRFYTKRKQICRYILMSKVDYIHISDNDIPLTQYNIVTRELQIH